MWIPYFSKRGLTHWHKISSILKPEITSKNNDVSVHSCLAIKDIFYNQHITACNTSVLFCISRDGEWWSETSRARDFLSLAKKIETPRRRCEKTRDGETGTLDARGLLVRQRRGASERVELVGERPLVQAVKSFERADPITLPCISPESKFDPGNLIGRLKNVS